MKKNILTLLITLLLTTASNSIYAYRWVMNNFTKQTLLVQIELLYSSNPYFVLVEPGQSADFDWSPGNTMAGFCLGKIKYLIPNNHLLNQEAFINRKTMEVTDNKKLLNWLDGMVKQAKEGTMPGLAFFYERKEAPIKLVKNDLFDEAEKQGGELTGTTLGANIVGYFANLVKESKCRGRDIMIVEKNGQIEFYAPGD